MIILHRFRKSLVYAWRGLADAWESEQSFRVHVLAFVLLLIIIIGLRIKGIEAAVLILVATMVIVLELANSIFERWLDIVSPRVGAHVRDAKDIMAAAVLVSSLAAIMIGAIIIIPHIKF
jgi:diacylglycerol kinase